ncbi:molecular chaperone GrpE [Candidatus Mancarchaeum acidiphilum]|uniref:Molecular chaperone GrpE n=1 Tax=Candidatus Mancarchaeum acidiphilum TaxID=1920749 RepID=A0A218NM27_9ARCH|nr:nucleotide exchange factor GrpE [Candidatus Mancarchaeum acidiphilum]ASI13516.1 molecular chaperone GrpE [Candidatus Mancarchaeum acidiphilum]
MDDKKDSKKEKVNSADNGIQGSNAKEDKDVKESRNEENKSEETSEGNKGDNHLVEVEEDLKARTEEVKEYKERMLRMAAEFDNYKRRVQVDLNNANSLGKLDVVKKLLPVIDEFELALKAVEKSNDKEVKEGIEMLYKNIMNILKKEGLEEIQSTGKYDPYLHDIAVVKESNDPDGHILQVISKGYKFNGNVIRPASVIISKKENDKGQGEKKENKDSKGSPSDNEEHNME